MGLETATYIAGLNESWPDGLDQRTTVDNHLRLIKATLKRTFPNVDGPVSLSALAFGFAGDLSQSVQFQLNNLRDGSHTANFAKYANSASLAVLAQNALAIGGTSLSDIAVLSRTNIHVTPSQWGNFAAGIGAVRAQPGNAVNAGYIEFYTPNGTRRGYMGWSNGSNRLFIESENSYGFDFVTTTNNGLPPTINGSAILHAGSQLIAANLIGSVPNSVITLASLQQHQAALNVASALTAGAATFASSAADSVALGSYNPSQTNAVNTVAVRNGSGDLFCRYVNMTGGVEEFTANAVLATNSTDVGGFYARRLTLAALGQNMDARNISTKSGTNKTFSTAAPSGGSNGDIWYRY